MNPHVTWLGQASKLGPCGDPPGTLTKSTFLEYAEKCGKDQAKAWLKKSTGVDVGNCLDEGTDTKLEDVPECVANNYGIKLGIIKDGEVQWDVVVNDAGAVGGIAVCAATGAGTAALSICGQTGAMLANIAYGVLEPLVGAFVGVLRDLFWGDDNKITYCNLNAPVDLVKVQLPGYYAGSSRALAQWMTNPGPQSLPNALGPLYSPGGVPGSREYWSRVLLMRGLAQASAIVLDGFRDSTKLDTKRALAVLGLKAPVGWVELIRPSYSGKEFDDAKLNIAALLDGFMAPEVIKKLRGDDVIVPSYMLPAFWNGVPVSPSVSNFFELQNVNQGCFTAIMWGTRDLKISRPAGPAYLRPKMQVYWEYTTPVVINALALAPKDVFLKNMLAWKASLFQNLSAKIETGKRIASAKPSKKSAAIPVVLTLGAAAAAAWWLLPKVVIR